MIRSREVEGIREVFLVYPDNPVVVEFDSRAGA